MKQKEIIEQTLIESLLLTPSKLEAGVDKIVEDNNELDYLEAIQIFSDENQFDYEDLIPLIQQSSTMIEKIETAATVTGKIKKNSSFI